MKKIILLISLLISPLQIPYTGWSADKDVQEFIDEMINPLSYVEYMLSKLPPEKYQYIAAGRSPTLIHAIFEAIHPGLSLQIPISDLSLLYKEFYLQPGQWALKVVELYKYFDSVLPDPRKLTGKGLVLYDVQNNPHSGNLATICFLAKNYYQEKHRLKVEVIGLDFGTTAKAEKSNPKGQYPHPSDRVALGLGDLAPIGEVYITRPPMEISLGTFLRVAQYKGAEIGRMTFEGNQYVPDKLLDYETNPAKYKNLVKRFRELFERKDLFITLKIESSPGSTLTQVTFKINTWAQSHRPASCNPFEYMNYLKERYEY